MGTQMKRAEKISQTGPDQNKKNRGGVYDLKEGVHSEKKLTKYGQKNSTEVCSYIMVS